MKNNFVVVLNDLPIECNRQYLESNFHFINRSFSSTNNLFSISKNPRFLMKSINNAYKAINDNNDNAAITNNQHSIRIEGGNEFFEVTRNILQGNNYEITNENYEYLKKLSDILKSDELITKLNSFYYNDECDNNQIDQHPAIQYLQELYKLIHQLSSSNYEDISSQIIQKISPLNATNKDKKQKKKKGKKKSNEEIEDDVEIIKEKTICLKKVGKKSITKLFFYEIVNCLSSQFKTTKEFQEHKDKVKVVVQLIKDIDAYIENDDENDDLPDGPKTYLQSFIDYVLGKYQKVHLSSSSLSNHKQEIFYLVNFLLSNDIIPVKSLHEGTDINQENNNKIWLPDYFLHFYPDKMKEKYFKENANLLNDDENTIKPKSKKSNRQKNLSKEDKYIQEHESKVENGFDFDDDVLSLIAKDNLDDFKNFVRSKLIEKVKINKKNRIKGKVNENTIINSYRLPQDTCKLSCISTLNNCSIIEIAAFFESVNIFQYLINKLINREISEPSQLSLLVIASQNPKIIDLYIQSIVEISRQTFAKQNNVNDDGNVNENDDNDNEDYDSDYVNENNGNVNEDVEENKIEEIINPDIAVEMKVKRVVTFKIKKLMPSCIEHHKSESYNHLNNYLLKYQEQGLNRTNTVSELDKYLKKAISRGYFDLIPLLLKEGGTLNILLNLFCNSNNEVGIEYILEFRNIDVNYQYKNKTPLEYCIFNRNEYSSLLILNNDKFDINKEKKQIYVFDDTDKENKNEIKTNRRMKNTLSDKISNKKQAKNNSNNTNDKTILHFACEYGLSKVVEYFLKKDLFDVNTKTSEGITPIHLACKSGSFETVNTIVKEKKRAVKYNGKATKGEYKGFTPLHFACIAGNPQIVEFLLESYKINANIEDGTNKWTPLQYAISNGHTEVTKILLNQPGIETELETKEGETLLHLACSSNKEDLVDLLLNDPNVQDFDLNQKTLKEKTPLQIALFNGNCNMVSVLLGIDGQPNKKGKKKSNRKETDIDPNLLTNNGKSPLIISLEMRRIDIFNLLIQHKNIDVNLQLATGKSALFAACELNLIDAVKKLLEMKNINTNLKTKLGNTPLIISCEKGNKDIVELLINYNDGNTGNTKKKGKNQKSKSALIDFNAKTNDGKTALLIACEYMRMDIAEMLVNIEEIECDDASDDGRTPLCYACEKGCEDLVTKLLDNIVDINHHTKDDRTPLYFAVQSRNTNIVKKILSRIDDNSQSNLKEQTNGTTPIIIACLNGDLEIFNLLIKNNESDDFNYQDNFGRTLLFAACEGENLEIVKTLLTQFNINPNIPNNEGKSPLHLACEMKNAEIVNLLVNNSSFDIKFNEYWNDMTPLEMACEKGSIEIVNTLLQQDGIQVNPTNKKEVPPLLCACEIWRTDIIKLLLDNVDDIDVDASQSDGRTALHYACEKGDVDITETILNKSANSISSRTTDKKTPIELACQNENINIISLLLKYISDTQINAKFFDGNTILSKACIQQSVDVVRYLLDNTIIDVNSTNNNNKTPLFIVAKNGNERICQMLLNKENIDIEMKINEKTALYEACKYGNAGVVELLLKKGARADCITRNGKTPLHVACQHGFNKVVSLLLNQPEVDVNLLTIATPEQIKSRHFKVFYSPLHIACMNKDFYRPPKSDNKQPQGHFSQFSFRNTFKRNTSNFDDNDNFNISRKSKANHQLCVELLINHPDINVNLQTSKNETALTIACSNKKLEIVKALLQNPNIDTNVCGQYNNTALHIACSEGKIDVIKMLLDIQQTNVNCENIDNETPLSISCNNNRTDIIKLLLNREDLIICKKLQINPIQNAINNNNSILFSIFLHHPTFDINGLDKNSVTPLGYAINEQNIEFILQILSTPGIDINKKFCTNNMNNGNRKSFGSRFGTFGTFGSFNRNKNESEEFSTPINYALKLNNLQIIKSIIQSPELDINEYSNGKTSLHDAIISGNDNIASLLLKSPNTDPNLITVFDEKPIRLLVNYEKIQRKNDPFLIGASALHIAVQKHNAHIVKKLIKRKDLLVNTYTSASDLSCLKSLKDKLYYAYTIRATNNRGFLNHTEPISNTEISVRFENQYKNNCNALFIACCENQPEIVSLLLLREDIDINAKSTSEELTPLHAAVKNGYMKIVNTLLNDERCDPSATSKDGTNIINFACQSHNIDLIKMLLSTHSGSLLNSRNQNGDTPLHYVCKSNDSEILNLLLKEIGKTPFDINVKNKQGDTPLHFAAKNNVPDKYYRIPKKKQDENSDPYDYIDEYKTKTVLGILLSKGADPNAVNNSDQTPLHTACASQLYNNINILLNLPDILPDGKSLNTPLSTLISQSILTNYKKIGNNIPSFSFGFSRFSSLNTNNSTISYQMTVPEDLIPTVFHFLDRGANFNPFNSSGYSLLHLGILCKSKRMVEFFFDHIKDSQLPEVINQSTANGTPINMAVNNWNNDIMHILLRMKDVIRFDDKLRCELIYKCATNNDLQSLLLLLLGNESSSDLEFDPNYVDSNNMTPLHIAAQNSNSLIACILANCEKVDSNILDSNGKSALHLACNRNECFTSLGILTKVDLKKIQTMFDSNTIQNFNEYLISQISKPGALNERININIRTQGITRREFFRRERHRELLKNPTKTHFNIFYHEPEFNIDFTPLHISVSNRLENTVRKLLQFPNLDINACSSHGDTASTIAAKNWDLNIINMLIDYNGINLNYVPSNEEEEDEYDQWGNHREPKDETKVDPNRPPHTLTSEEIYEIKRKKRNQNKTLLHAACENNSIELAKKLLKLSEEGVFDINGVNSFDGMAPLHYICENGNMELLNLFIEYEKRNPNCINWNIPNNNGMTPLHFATRAKHTEVVDTLINNEVICPHIDINATATGEFENGRTPISFACEKGLLDIVKLLLFDKVEKETPFSFEQKKKKAKRGSLCGARSDCDLSIKALGAHQKGMTPLHYACKSSNVEVVKLILKHGGFDINARANGKSCLFLACKHNRIEIVKLLLENEDINYNIKTPRGVTPLMIAAQEGRKQICEMLLSLRKIDKNAITVDGQSARDMAKNQDIVDLFDKYS